jgi:hypothetical protein
LPTQKAARDYAKKIAGVSGNASPFARMIIPVGT